MPLTCPLVALCTALSTAEYSFLPVASLSKGRDDMSVRAAVLSAGDGALPDAFDSRTAWPNCTSIALIPDQGACGDCWAVATVTAATDRWCIAKGENPPLSVENMVGCCRVCGYGCGDG